ncbi:DUF917 domain-containing protein [Agrobacterium larrymoorei]|uniref:DUF917 family protein n=1 Tax=Agrobacterium larrymoorei TaxID=160699 RepID=A0AAJ2B7N4_9HYPH|nr:DUF917 domain-containing protein [Agrobacterium larrymoorei]MDQ1184530.1 DUF917 family protein [Agrobacterium larrymoorei]MDR6099922.1 DUF917 family protein [Agrobacterium larrymoorei]
MARITDQDIDDLAVGAAVLGTGGGGDPYIGKLLAKAAIEKYGPVDLMALEDVPDGATVVACGAMGAPTILIEKIPSGDEGNLALETYEDHTGLNADAIIPFEAGGINSMVPIILAAKKRVPVIDADGMGRAFPQLEMETFNVYGVPASPVAVADERGNRVLIETADAAKAEWLARGVTIRMGGQAYIVNYGMDGQTTKKVSVPATMSLAIGIGRTLREAAAQHLNPVEALIAFFSGTHYGHAEVITSGKVADVARKEQNGWSVGIATIEPFDTSKPKVKIRIQNENLVAEEEGGRMLAIVPDLITILDIDTAEAITTERLRYGQRVNVLAVRVPPIMRTPEALAVFGPSAFGLTQAYQPLGS